MKRFFVAGILIGLSVLTGMAGCGTGGGADGTEKVSKPVISPAEGWYSPPQEVTITCATEGAEIYYTTDGSTTPDAANGTLYTGPFQITTTITVRAVGCKDGFEASEVATEALTLTTQKIVYNSDPSGYPTILVRNADGSGDIEDLDCHGSGPDWSPDTTKIAFYSSRDGDDEIFVMDADGENQTQLTDNEYTDAFPDWSPDGTKIVFHSDRPWGISFNIFVMDADGSNPVQLTTVDTGIANTHPVWSPDGSRIAFASKSGGNEYEICVMDADGTNLVNITNNAASDTTPSWSGNGKIAFVSYRAGDANSEIYTMEPDGSSLVRLTTTENTVIDIAPCWSPNGFGIAFSTNRDGDDMEIYRMRASDGGNVTKVTNNFGGITDGTPDWADVVLY
jgi:Tol biopolymer transport system component